MKLVTSSGNRVKGINVMDTFYLGVILTTSANIFYLNKVSTYGVGEFSMYYYISLEHIDMATKLWAIGNTFIFIGYELFAKKSFPSISIDIKGERGLKILFNVIVLFAFLTISGNLARLAVITGGLQKVVSLLNIMGIMFFARLWVKENNIRYRNYAIILCVMQTTIALLVSFLRVELLTPTISFFGGYFIAKGEIKYLFSYRMVVPLIILGIFALFFRALSGNRAHFISAFTKTTDDRFKGPERSEYLELGNVEDGGLMERNANVAQLTNIVKLVEKNGYYQGKVSAPLVAAFIPRALWPDKPRVQLGAWFALEIGAAVVGENGRVNNSINMSVPGQLFLDFGWIGLCIGGILFGGLVAMFWNAAQFNESFYNLSGAMWGGYLLLYSLAGIGVDLQIVVSLFSTYFVFFFFKKLVKPYENTINRPAVAR